MNILVFGATSDIVRSTLNIWAEHEHRIFLVSRDGELQDRIAADLKVRGAQIVSVETWDAENPESLTRILQRLEEKMERIDLLYIGFGLLGRNDEALKSRTLARRILQVNFLATVDVLVALLPRFEQQRSGQIAVISSVAGERVRGSLAVYGAAKAGVSDFLEGLRQRLHPLGIPVTVIKPGVIRTDMTEHVKPAFFHGEPDRAAPVIVKGIEQGRDVIYVPRWWRPVMWLVRHIPACIFKRMRV